MYKVYLSPSTQERNRFIVGGITEEQNSNAICDILQQRLVKKYGMEVKRNSPSMDMQGILNDSNAFAPTIHVAMHSNAGGGKGCEVFAYMKAGKVTNSQKLAQAIYDEFEKITPSKDRGVKNGVSAKLAEITKTKATAVLVEMAFHDNKDDAQWLINNRNACAIAYEKGICKYLGIAYKPDEVPKPVEHEHPIYRVQVGAYSIRANSEKMLASLKAKGFSGYIVSGMSNGKPIYRTQVGAFGVQANAQRMLDNLKSKGFVGYIVKGV